MNTDYAITDTPPLATLTRRAHAERAKLAASLAAIDGEIAAANDATAQEREAEADRDRALADATALRDRQAVLSRQIEDHTAVLTALCRDAVAVDHDLAGAERRSGQQHRRQWMAQRLATFIQWQLAAGGLPGLGMPHHAFRRPLIDPPPATGATTGADVAE